MLINGVLYNMQAFDTFGTIAEVCGDFVHRRFMDDVVPKIISSLSKLAPKRYRNAVDTQTYSFIQAYYFQGVLVLQKIHRTI